MKHWLNLSSCKCSSCLMKIIFCANFMAHVPHPFFVLCYICNLTPTKQAWLLPICFHNSQPGKKKGLDFSSHHFVFDNVIMEQCSLHVTFYYIHSRFIYWSSIILVTAPFQSHCSSCLNMSLKQIAL